MTLKFFGWRGRSFFGHFTGLRVVQNVFFQGFTQFSIHFWPENAQKTTLKFYLWLSSHTQGLILGISIAVWRYKCIVWKSEYFDFSCESHYSTEWGEKGEREQKRDERDERDEGEEEEEKKKPKEREGRRRWNIRRGINPWPPPHWRRHHMVLKTGVQASVLTYDP